MATIAMPPMRNMVLLFIFQSSIKNYRSHPTASVSGGWAGREKTPRAGKSLKPEKGL
jgi:hypothetical protein